MSVQTECRTWKLVFESYAEVQPDFASAKIQPKHPEIQIFLAPDIAPLFFQQLHKAPNPFIYKHFKTIFKREKKMK